MKNKLVIQLYAVLSCQSFMTLCDPMEPRQAPLSMGILQARTLEWVAMTSPPGDLSNPGTEPRSPALQADSLLSEKPGKPYSTILQYKIKKKKVTNIYQISSFTSYIFVM